jgi:hypothetical protein
MTHFQSSDLIGNFHPPHTVIFQEATRRLLDQIDNLFRQGCFIGFGGIAIIPNVEINQMTKLLVPPMVLEGKPFPYQDIEGARNTDSFNMMGLSFKVTSPFQSFDMVFIHGFSISVYWNETGGDTKGLETVLAFELTAFGRGIDLWRVDRKDEQDSANSFQSLWSTEILPLE